MNWRDLIPEPPVAPSVPSPPAVEPAARVEPARQPEPKADNPLHGEACHPWLKRKPTAAEIQRAEREIEQEE